jgi:hypothetical protein
VVETKPLDSKPAERPAPALAAAETFKQSLLSVEPLAKLVDLLLLRSHLRLQTFDLILCPRRCFRRVRISQG